MLVKNERDPGSVVGVHRVVTPHAATLVIHDAKLGAIASVILDVDDLIELLTECEDKLRLEVRYFREMLHRKETLSQVSLEALSAERGPYPPL